MSTPIQYEAAVAEFEEGLLNALRGHAAATECLELWVPDEDPVRSILNMAESAEAFGQPTIAVALRRTTLPSGRDEELVQVLSELGHVQLEPLADGVVVTISNLGAASALDHVHDSLRNGIQRQLGAIAHEGALPDGSGLSISASDGPATLTALVDAGHTIVAARHAGARTPVERAVLEALCVAIEGVPVQDAGDHGPIRALAALRDSGEARPVQGILLPANADPAFVPAVHLAQRLRDAWRAQTGVPYAYNEFDRPPSSVWLGMSAGERLERVSREVAAAGIGAEVLRMDDDLHGQPVRVVVTFADTVTARDKPDLMRALERALKASVEGKLQLYHEQRKDENEIRRL